MALTVAQAEQVARVIWKRATGIPDRAKRVKALRRASLLVQLAQGRERLRATDRRDVEAAGIGDANAATARVD
jgi:hypothetical protein